MHIKISISLILFFCFQKSLMKKKLQDNGLGDKWLIKLEWKMKIKIQYVEIEHGYILERQVYYIIMNLNLKKGWGYATLPPYV